ncbi:glutathione S-transferase zeta class-like isoform X3 [Impatiens glandulifera]|uniref:glutathione S-transferase zeta class-like isoform X2 n=1 Tax=Impatiens glandulifera TaxID=253017 RepID=UPI001FB08D12|nr:glutathione S-transferase zeta class-like isoform X2 [Impatiens glandulifera]XP_047338483.1 glutathione S-transferase zeta class-like isoform X3 [Impatiens glandulifera]
MSTDDGQAKKLKLYSFWRSSCSFRIRFALNLKGLEYDLITVNLYQGEHRKAEYLKINPIGFVPALVDDDIVVADSFAIALYLEEKYPQHPLLPDDLQKRAINYQVATIVCSSIQPFQNLGGNKFMDDKISLDEKIAWIKAQIEKGLSALENLLHDHAGKYVTGDEIALGDVFLAPQIHAAILRFSIDMTKYPVLSRCYDGYNELPAFLNALPENQPDFPAMIMHTNEADFMKQLRGEN